MPKHTLIFKIIYSTVMTVNLLLVSNMALATTWDDLWLTHDQQGNKSFNAGKHTQAASQYKDPQWKASSLYRSKDYKTALEYFSQSESIDAKYNKANSLAHLKKFKEALKAYDEVLDKQPQHADSLKNKKIIEDMLKKQQQEKDKKDKKNKDKSDEKNQENKSDKENKSDSNDGDTDQEDKENKKEKNQNNNKNNKDQKNNEQKDSDKSNDQKSHDEQKKQEKEALESKKNNDEKQTDKEENKKQMPQSQFSKLSDEEQQSMEQYLNQIKDDPAYLLRRKFYLNSTRSKQQNSNKTQVQQPW